jgi:hypothetical protein
MVIYYKFEGKGPLRRTSHRWWGGGGSNGMYLKEIWQEDVELIHLAHDSPVAGFCEHSNKPPGSIKGRKFHG